MKAAPAPRPAIPPAPFGDLSRAPLEEIRDIATGALKGHSTRSNADKRRRGMTMLLSHLEKLPGETWQERWEAGGFDAENAPSVTILAREASRSDGADLVAAVKMTFCLRVLRPSVSGFRANKFIRYSEPFRDIQNDPHLDDFFEVVDGHPTMGHIHKSRAKFDLTCALTTQGIALQDLTPSALLHYSLESKRLGVTHGANKNTNRFAALGAWQVLHRMGHFPPETPPTLRTFVYSGQRTIEEMVDRYAIQNRGVRQLLIDYLTRRRAETDYVTVEGLARNLAKHFWAKIEELSPGHPDLSLGHDLYDQWRAELQTYGTGSGQEQRKRMDPESIVLAVRGLYVDLHSWAVEEPERWAQWVVPCPIRPQDLKGFGKRRREINRRMADRVRTRQPLLPALVAHLEARHEFHAGLLSVARPTELGEEFTHEKRRYRRRDSIHDRRMVSLEKDPSVRITDEETGEKINVTVAEDSAFWEWAAVELLRHSGIRVEELCELTHLSIRQYQRPNGEVIALLVVAPSKSERERVIPMSAELFHVVAQIVRRHTCDGRKIPLVTRYDPHERTWSEPMPFLMQRYLGTARGVMSGATVLNMLGRSCKELALSNPAFEGLKFTPHDFRRLFATEVVNGGLPIHIGAALLGHLNLQTTQGYVAVFAEDVVGHYQAFLNHRRSLRPDGEYGEVTPQEWDEFEEHFDKRKVELGNCARPYGTPCQHEHACIRCPMLQINPKMLPRLAELEKDLLRRRKKAEEEQWLGEIDGIDLTLTFLRTKQAEAARLTHRPVVELGLPRPRRERPEVEA
ncbi:site-specific integrase [Streptomyces sp. NBC_00347]|uniref:site-specific integrase n=1 Tax=Streptomyces sp. NBC_00347 TaxID=2975721 RepID=UPI002259F732|nr:site-specific integrase [Streptomyces sp. NBC_00347]MCX5124343.1 site-specific integrase [Streptomyces sp. NBC_00347]